MLRRLLTGRRGRGGGGEPAASSVPAPDAYGYDADAQARAERAERPYYWVEPTTPGRYRILTATREQGDILVSDCDLPQAIRIISALRATCAPATDEEQPC
jgi:hypothetical protein